MSIYSLKLIKTIKGACQERYNFELNACKMRRLNQTLNLIEFARMKSKLYTTDAKFNF
jgi:hypothetical protein